MDLTNSTGIDTEYKVSGNGDSSPRVTRKVGQETWKKLGPNDYAVVRPLQKGPWRVTFYVNGKLVDGVADSSKASVVLTEANGKFQVQTSVAAIDAFIAYSAAEKGWAESLDAALRKNGVSTWLDSRSLKPGALVLEELERAIGEAKNIVLLVGSEEDVTNWQRLEWMAALDAVWQDSTKRLIPILLGRAEPPGFIRSVSHWGRSVAAIRVKDPARDWDRVTAVLVEVLKSEVDPRKKGELLDTAEEDRRLWQERMTYIKRVAAEFK